jgi:hypothetical protein
VYQRVEGLRVFRLHYNDTFNRYPHTFSRFFLQRNYYFFFFSNIFIFIFFLLFLPKTARRVDSNASSFSGANSPYRNKRFSRYYQYYYEIAVHFCWTCKGYRRNSSNACGRSGLSVSSIRLDKWLQPPLGVFGQLRHRLCENIRIHCLRNRMVPSLPLVRH